MGGYDYYYYLSSEESDIEEIVPDPVSKTKKRLHWKKKDVIPTAN